MHNSQACEHREDGAKLCGARCGLWAAAAFKCQRILPIPNHTRLTVHAQLATPCPRCALAPRTLPPQHHSLSTPSWLTAATNFWCISTDHVTRGFLEALPSSSPARSCTSRRTQAQGHVAAAAQRKWSFRHVLCLASTGHPIMKNGCLMKAKAWQEPPRCCSWWGPHQVAGGKAAAAAAAAGVLALAPAERVVLRALLPRRRVVVAVLLAVLLLDLRTAGWAAGHIAEAPRARAPCGDWDGTPRAARLH